MKSSYKRAGALLTVCAILLAMFPTRVLADSGAAPTPSVTFTFTDSGVTALSGSASGFSIDGASLTISAAGTYALTGSCSEGNVTVAKGVTGVVLVLSSLTLSCSTTAPLLCKKGAGVTLWLNGASTLTDNEDASTEDTNSDFEGAAVKVKSEGASLTIRGTGSLTADGSACKNGIKAGATSAITVSGGTLNITAANNGLSADGAVIIKGGTLNITATNDGIKASPDDGDTESAGTITIYDGEINVSAESDGINAAGDIAIYGGKFVINTQSDGIQTDSNLTISDGTFNITTLNGYNSSGFNSDTMSCKGLKASASDDDTDNATNTISVTGGTFVLNTADDAIHSDAYIEITGGKFTINTGDDGAHADTSLILGTSGGTVARDPDMTISNSYEGLEAGTVYIYSGRYYVIASDDGINAAGGSNSGSDPGGGGGNHFNPGGGAPGGRPMMFGNAQLLATTEYSINIMGGNVYANAEGDGLDSNGDLTLTGGNIEVWGQYNRDNEPLDYNGTLTVNGATVFAAGSAGMGMASPSSGSQSYKNFSNSYSSGAVVIVTNGSSAVYNAIAPKNVNYVFFSAPNVSSPALSSGSGVNCQRGNAWTHSWNSGVVTTAATESASGLRTYACSVCGATETETIPQLVSIPEDEENGGDTEDAGYTVTFVTKNCSVNIYHTHDYATPDEMGVTSTVSRNSDTGEPDSAGSGQVNFAVIPNDGYAVSLSTEDITGTFKNLKSLADDEDNPLENGWRITKIESNLTVNVSAMESDSGDASENIFVEISLDLSEKDISAGTYCLVVGFYTSDGQLLGTDSATVTVDNALCAEASVTCPSLFDACAAFILDSSDYTPVCGKTELTIVSQKTGLAIIKRHS